MRSLKMPFFLVFQTATTVPNRPAHEHPALGLCTVYSASSIFRPPINRPGSTGRYSQLFSLKSTRFTVEKN